MFMYTFSLKKIMRDPTERDYIILIAKIVNLRSIFWYFILLFVNQFDNLNTQYLSYLVYLCGILIEITYSATCLSADSVS